MSRRHCDKAFGSQRAYHISHAGERRRAWVPPQLLEDPPAGGRGRERVRAQCKHVESVRRLRGAVEERNESLPGFDKRRSI